MKRFIKDIKKYFRYAIYSARSELKAEVANSYLNWIWWILEPICFMLIYTFVFTVAFNATEPYFPIFIFIGLTIWEFFNRNTINSVKMLQNNKAIITKVYLPKFILILSKMMVNGFKMFISFCIIVVMMLIYRVPVTWNILYLLPVLITVCLFTFGVMTLILHFGVFVEDLSNIVNIFLRLLFYLTGIFYSVETRLKGYGTLLVKINPVAFFLKSARDCILYGTAPSRKLLLFWFLISCCISYIGVLTIYKNENSYVKVM